MTAIDPRDLEYAISRAHDLGSSTTGPDGEPVSVEETLMRLRRLMTPLRPDGARDEIAVWNMSQFCAVLEAELGDRLVRDGINRATTFSGIPIVTDPSIPEGEIEFRTAAGEKRRVKIIEL